MALVALLAFSGQSVGQSTPTRVASTAPRAAELSSQRRPTIGHAHSLQLYRAHCIDCHATDGRGESSRETMKSIPDFTDSAWHMVRSDERLLRSIREGKGSMPAMKETLETNDVVALVALIRNFRDGRQVVTDGPDDDARPQKPGEADSPLTGARDQTPRPISRLANAPAGSMADAGRAHYQRLCISCHGADGRGAAMRSQVPGFPDFTSPDWHSGRSDAQIKTSVLEGKGTRMPTFSGRLNDAQTRSLVAFVRSMAPTPDRSSPAGSTDFHRRFEQMKEEMNDLKRQYHALSRPSSNGSF
jgi:mono/diheme cytochrome c family protein